MSHEFHDFEVDCILTTKVYDFCFLNVHQQECFEVDTIAPGTPVDCEFVPLTSGGPLFECEEVVGLRQQLPDGRAQVTIRKRFRVRIFNPSTGQTITTQTRSKTETIRICAPPGVDVVCEIASFGCGPCQAVNGTVCCQVDFCQLIEAMADVKLLVPTFGFCEPVPCELFMPKEFVCPPEQLFPEQCPQENN